MKSVVSNFFWAMPIKIPYVTVNFTEFWVKQPSFNVCVWHQYSHKFYSMECSKQEIHNSVKAGIIQKLCYLMERSDINFLGTAPSSNLICAASKPLQITILFMLPPCSCAQQCAPGIYHQHRAASSCVSSSGWLVKSDSSPTKPCCGAEPQGSCIAYHPQSWGSWMDRMGWATSPGCRFVIKWHMTNTRLHKKPVKLVTIQQENTKQIKPFCSPSLFLKMSKFHRLWNLWKKIWQESWLEPDKKTSCLSSVPCHISIFYTFSRNSSEIDMQLGFQKAFPAFK